MKELSEISEQQEACMEMTLEERIRDRAYFLSQSGGGGDETYFWLTAEREVLAELAISEASVQPAEAPQPAPVAQAAEAPQPAASAQPAPVAQPAAVAKPAASATEPKKAPAKRPIKTAARKSTAASKSSSKAPAKPAAPAVDSSPVISAVVTPISSATKPAGKPAIAAAPKPRAATR
jgi:hypothetical protein